MFIKKSTKPKITCHDKQPIVHQPSAAEMHATEQHVIQQQYKATPPETENNYFTLQWLTVIFAEIAVFALLALAFPLVTMTVTATIIGIDQLYQFFTKKSDPDSVSNCSTSTFCL